MLQVLDLSVNTLVAVPGIAALVNLRQLLLSNNQLRCLPHRLECLTALQASCRPCALPLHRNQQMKVSSRHGSTPPMDSAP
jgi:Leucine-rich repeat (LRR) protein